MGIGDDPQLTELLRSWRVPNAPPSLDARVSGVRRNWWAFLLTGSIRVPVPVGIATLVILLAMGGALLRLREAEPAASASAINLMEFQPVGDLNVRVFRHHDAN
jgi:hypothetical protein